MTAISNDRTDPWTGAVSWRTMDTEQATIAQFSELPGKYGIRLQDHPNTGVTLGIKVISGIAIASIANTAGNTWRYNFSGSPNLSSVSIGYKIHIFGATTAANNGVFLITGVNDGADWIEITNASGVVQVGSGGTAAVTSTDFTEITTGSPLALQFRPDYSSHTGMIWCSLSDSGTVVLVEYEGGGSIGVHP